MRKVLNDISLNEEFVKQGFVQTSFLSAEEVEELKQHFFETLPLSGGQITAAETEIKTLNEITYDFTFIDKNPDYKKQVFDMITQKFKKRMDELLYNYKPIIANFIRKKTDKGEVPLHQNWAFADEHKCYTVSIWCPLVDSTVANGTLQVVPRSHKRFGEVRGPLIPWELENIKDIIIKDYLIPLETKAGDCVILDDSIIHYSAPNLTNDLRLAIQLICIPNEEPSLHFYGKGSTIDVLEVDKEFYFQFNPWKKPEGYKKISEIQHQPKPLNEKEFVKRLNGPTFENNSFSNNKYDFLSTFKKIFKW